MGRFLRSAGNALRGVARALRAERNLRIELCVAVQVVFWGILGNLEPLAWAACLVCFGAVTGTELHNTALERLCEKVCRDKDDLIRDAKDAAAGGVLLTALGAAGAGLLVFLRAETLRAVGDALGQAPWLWGVFAASVLLSLWGIRGKKKWN